MTMTVRNIGAMLLALTLPACILTGCCHQYTASIVARGSQASIAETNHPAISVTTVRPGNYVVTFPAGATNPRCTDTLDHTIGYITAGDTTLGPNQIRILTYGPIAGQSFTVVAER